MENRSLGKIGVRVCLGRGLIGVCKIGCWIFGVNWCVGKGNGKVRNGVCGLEV